MAIRVVFFDLGETLFTYGQVDIEEMFVRGARLTYEYLQELSGDEKLLPDFKIYHRRHILSIKSHYIWSNITKREFDCISLLEEKARGMGLQPDKKQLEQLAWLWYQPLAENAVLEEGLAAHLEVLRDMSLKLAIISNTFLPGSVLDRHLESFDLLKFFPVRVYSSDTIFRKPDRRIYETGLRKAAVSAPEAVMVGDKIREDIKGARKLGMRTVLKRTVANHTRKFDNDITTINAISELPGLIRRWS